MAEPQNILIAPSILSADFGQLAREAQRVEQGGGDWLHCDVMDGHFVPNLTFGPDTIAGLRKATRLPLDVHLMIEHADRFVDRFIDAGADHITVHVEPEAKHDVAKTLARIRARGKRVGLSLNPATPVESALTFLDRIDLLLVMSVNPGFGGQAFMPEVLPKIQALRHRGPALDIVVDGGINVETGRRCIEAGANVLVAGNSLFRHSSLDLAGAITALRGSASEPWAGERPRA